MTELAQEGAKLREAIRCARRVFNLNAALRNNRFAMLDSGQLKIFQNTSRKKCILKVDNQHHNLKSSLDIFKDMCIRPMN